METLQMTFKVTLPIVLTKMMLPLYNYKDEK